MEAISPFIAGGAAVAILSLSIYLVLNLVGITSTQNRNMEARIGALEGDNRQLKRENLRCERRLNLVINTCNESGVKIPAEVWMIDGEGEDADAG